MAGRLLPGDPARIADAVLTLADLKDPSLHLLLGEDVLNVFRQKLEDWRSMIEERTEDRGPKTEDRGRGSSVQA